MGNRIRVEGDWPSPVTLTSGWARATARPWNDLLPDAYVRMERGTRDFLSAATETVAGMSSGAVYSPPIYPRMARVWRRCGYEEAHQLEILERPTVPTDKLSEGVEVVQEPDWDRIMEIDAHAFQGFWRMSRAGLEEALRATRRSVVLTATRSKAVGYAIVGGQWDVSYLQRVAVDPTHSGQGIGSLLVKAALTWSRASGARVMVLNVRRENERAMQLYKREGFSSTGTALSILRYETRPASLLN